MSNLSTNSNHESLCITELNHVEEISTVKTATDKKKEKIGLFRKLRRRLQSNFNRKSLDNDKNIVNTKSKSPSKKHKQNCRINLCSKPSNSNSSQSAESLDMNILQRKLDENIWSNRDRDCAFGREKASCKSKDISAFQAASPNSCLCNSSVDPRDTTSKITNMPSNSSSNRFEITALCHSNGINRNAGLSAVNIIHGHGYTSSIPEGALTEVPRTWSLPHELHRLSKFGWYWGPITRREAERKLNGQPDGAFLVRDSSDERYLLSLSFRSYGKTLHTRIEHCNGKFIFDAQPDTEGYPSIVDLIENSMNDPQTGICSYSRRGSPSPPIYPVRLTKPVSRFSQVRTLQNMCRFVIRQYTRYDHIQQLPLPKKLKGWIGENQY